MRTPFLDREAMRDAARTALDNLGITTVRDIDAPVESLSGGQRQSVAIARAVRERARVVILDEPTAALGVAQSAQVLLLMERLRASGTAVLVVSHNLREVFAISDVVVVVRLGRIAEVFETAKTDEEEVVGAIVGAKGRQRTMTAPEHPAIASADRASPARTRRHARVRTIATPGKFAADRRSHSGDDRLPARSTACSSTRATSSTC